MLRGGCAAGLMTTGSASAGRFAHGNMTLSARWAFCGWYQGNRYWGWARVGVMLLVCLLKTGENGLDTDFLGCLLQPTKPRARQLKISM